jgi:hypothetical protein
MPWTSTWQNTPEGCGMRLSSGRNPASGDRWFANQHCPTLGRQGDNDACHQFRRGDELGGNFPGGVSQPLPS